jgi:hypothetical protein
MFWPTLEGGQIWFFTAKLISKGFMRLSQIRATCAQHGRGGILMDVPLELTSGEEEALTRDRALTADSKGRLTLVGLTVEESIWYIEHKRQWLAERIDDTLRRKSREAASATWSSTSGTSSCAFRSLALSTRSAQKPPTKN